MRQVDRFGPRCVAVIAWVATAAALYACGGSAANSTYTVGGTVAGLAGSGLVLQDSNGGQLAIAANGSFVLPATMSSGSSYAVTPKGQPTNPAQNCVIANASGQVTDANVSDVAVTCTIQSRFAYASSHSGISCFAVDAGTGALTPLKASPCDVGVLTSVAVDPTGQFAYATVSDSNQIRAYTIDTSTGNLTAIVGSQLDAGGGASNPVDVTVDPSGHFVYMANYGGSISAFLINSTTGGLSPVPGSPFPTAGAAIAGQVPGSNSVAVDPNGKFLYAAVTQGNDISAYVIDSSSGALTSIPGSPFAAGRSPMTVRVDPSGKFAFVTNGNSNAISAYSIDITTGALMPVPGSPFPTGGSTPTGLTVDPSNGFVYVTNSDSNTISAFTIDIGTGVLIPIAGSPFPSGSSPISAAIHPSGQYLYVGSGDIYGYRIDRGTGTLTPITGSPFAPIQGSDGPYSFAFAD